jgi:hypothetical protein
MAKQQWYVHLDGDTVGPLSTENVNLMLKQNRLQFVDFIWAPPAKKWQRIVDVDEFSKMAPVYPTVAVPKAEQPEQPSKKTNYVVESAPKETPKPAPKPAAKTAVTAVPEGDPTYWPRIRKFLRLDGSGEKVSLAGRGDFVVASISEGGVFCISNDPLDVGTDLKLQLKLPGKDKPLEMTGVVIRKGKLEGKEGFAIEFTRVNPAHRRHLAEHIQRKASEK